MRVGRGIVWRWCARWLAARGLLAVAEVMEQKAARAGDLLALHAVARRALTGGQPEQAIKTLDDAIVQAARSAPLWCTRGAAHRHLLDFAAARADYEQALALDPSHVQSLSNLGECCFTQGEYAEALAWLDRALAIEPDFFEAQVNHVAALYELGRVEEAQREAEALVASHLDSPEAWVNLGNILVHIGKGREAVSHYQRALALRPDYEEAHFNMSVLVNSAAGLSEAIGYIERKIKLSGETRHRLVMLAAARQAVGDLGIAEDLCRRVLERQPDDVSALCTLASALSHGGDAAAALPVYQRIAEVDPEQARMGSNTLFEMNYLGDLDRAKVFAAHDAWAQRYTPPLAQMPDFSAWDRDPERKLRIGYVSGDFSRHPVGFLFQDVLAHHDRSQVEIHCFSMVFQPDEVTEQIRGSVDHWEDIFLLNDEEATAALRAAQLDILVDLSGHTAFHRLLSFAERPAPVQVSWIGYFHSTGLSAMDYFLTDPYTTPADGGQLFSETPLWLPATRFCFRPPAYTSEVGPLPCEEKGYVTFGSFNRLPKLTKQVIAAWSKIVLAVPDSRLVLKARALKDPVVRERLLKRFAEHGVAAERIELREVSSHAQMFSEYNDLDLALDPFPFNGGMTTLEALWMGVPVLTIAGDTVVSRQSHAALANVGLTEALSCPDVEAYVARAIALAQQPAELARLRAELRSRMAASPLCRPEQFSRDLEALYRDMWRAWCAGERLPAHYMARAEPAQHAVAGV